MSLNNSFLAKFNDVCRTCLKGGQLLTYLYDEQNNINLVTKLKSCTALQFDKNDQMPNKICPTCIEELLQAYNFINKCQISDATLKKYFSHQSVVKIEDDETPPSPLESLKTEVSEDDEQYTIVSDITVKDELIGEAGDSCAFTDTKIGRKRNREFGVFECSVDLSSKKKRVDSEFSTSAAVFNNTVSGVESASSDDVEAVPPRRTQSEIGKENFTKRKSKPKFPYRSRKKKYTCPVCEKRCMSSLGLLTHLQGHIEADGNNKESGPLSNVTEQITNPHHNHQCQICRQTCNEPHDLLDHYKQHIAKSKCVFCGKLFKTAHLLQKHTQENHTGSHPYKCELCNKKMADANALHAHKTQLHSAAKSHRCGVCSCTFDSVHELKAHVVGHVRGAAPHQCQTCGHAFEDAQCLVAHKVGEKCGRFYICLECPEVFQQLKYRNLHKTKYH